MSELIRKNIIFSLVVVLTLAIIASGWITKSYADGVEKANINYTDQKIDTVIVDVNTRMRFIIEQDSITREIICSKIDTIINKIHGRGD